MKTTNSSKGRTFTSYDKDRYERWEKGRIGRTVADIINPEIMKLYRQASSEELGSLGEKPSFIHTLEVIAQKNEIPLYSGKFAIIAERFPQAASFQISVQIFIMAIKLRRKDAIAYATKQLKDQMIDICKASLENSWFNCESVGYFNGASSSLEASIVRMISEDGSLADFMLKQKLNTFIEYLIDSITICVNIAQERSIYIHESFCITYCRPLIPDKKRFNYGELMIAIRDSDGIWSLDADSSVRISLTVLRQAKRAIASWRGSELSGQVTHEVAQRLVDYLGLTRIPDSKKNLVGILRPKGKGFS